MFYISFAHNKNVQFPPPSPQASSNTCSPNCFSVLHLMLFKSVLVSAQSLRFLAPLLQCPERECTHTLWSSFSSWVCPNRWWLSVDLGERKAAPTTSERAASLRSPWHQRQCRPLTDEQKHMVPHLASSLACSFPQCTSALWLSLSHCLTVEQRRLLSKDSFGKQQPSDLTANE